MYAYSFFNKHQHVCDQCANPVIFRAAIKMFCKSVYGSYFEKILKENFNRAEFKRQINTGIIRIFLRCSLNEFSCTKKLERLPEA